MPLALAERDLDDGPVIAVFGDIHMREHERGRWRPALEWAAERSDAILLAGDLTEHGSAPEWRALAGELTGLPGFVYAVLGNHDLWSGMREQAAIMLNLAGAFALDPGHGVITTPAGTLGIAGAIGCEGGFAPHDPPKDDGPADLDTQLAAIAHARWRVAMTHYAPCEQTLAGERPAIHDKLGSYHLGDVIDRHRPDLAVHCHAHAGTHQGRTPGGVLVFNDSSRVTRTACVLHRLGNPSALAIDTAILPPLTRYIPAGAYPQPRS